MGKSLIIPGADFSAVAIPFIAQVTIAANKQAVIYNGNNNVFFIIEADTKERTIDLTDNLSVDDITLFDFTFSRQPDVFKSIVIDVSYVESTMQFALYCETGTTSILEEVLFVGVNENNLNLNSFLNGQNRLKNIDLSCFHGTISAEMAFYQCRNVETINLHNATGLTGWANMFTGCYELKTIDLTSMVSLENMSATAGSGPFVGCSKLETVICPNLNSASLSLLIKQISAAANKLMKKSNGNLVVVYEEDTPGWTYTYGTPDPATMTLWDSSVWDNPVVGTTYYLDASLDRLYTYNGV